MSYFENNQQRLFFRRETETLIVEAWNENSLRVRNYKFNNFTNENFALLPVSQKNNPTIEISEDDATITNGKIKAVITKHGKITFYNQRNDVLLEEYNRNLNDVCDEKSSLLAIQARQFKPIINGDFLITARFEANPGEKIYGMGQYQHPYLDLKGAELELAQRNSQASVPFALSSLGYGFLWNNPAIGRASFAKNMTYWHAESTKILDYWITAGDTPCEISKAYSISTGTVPMMPDYAMGFWQCKLRYYNQQEVLNIAREYKRRGLPISVIVIDFFHWIQQGDWDFDPEFWPDPEKMVAELKSMDIELMVSIWPTVDFLSKNYKEMKEKGYLISAEKGVNLSLSLVHDSLYFDTTNPDARNFVWEKVKKGYYDKGIKLFWLDQAEPEYSAYDFENYRYHLGPNTQIGNLYPSMYSKTFYDGMQSEGQENIINLVRCAWAGSQRYGALVWSGDIASSFNSFRNQVVAGLNMGMAGLPWWTTDIGGFHGGDPKDPKFIELLTRWFQYGTFCPVMRLHGFRQPEQPIYTKDGQLLLGTGADNEVWSFGEDTYTILCKYLKIREAIKPYITTLMERAHQDGTPVIRTLFYEFPDDKNSWDIEDEYMFGGELLVAPITYENMKSRKVYLPKGADWTYVWDGKKYGGGCTVEIDTPIDIIPLFYKNDTDLGIQNI